MHEMEQLDIQQVVEELRFFLQSSDRTSSDRLGVLAQEYARHCDEINIRLRRCQECLRKGLRSEAIHLADAKPPLLDQVTLLDFPERAEWDETTGMYGLQTSPGLLLDVAADLNEAYALEQPLEGIMRRHRLAALGREPLSVRLQIMRQIQKHDPDSQVWRDDIREFEKSRFSQIESEAGTAATKGSSDALRRLAEELSDTAWSVKPPAALVRNVERLSMQVAQSGARTVLERIEPEINAACAALDVPRATQLRANWEKNAAIAGLKANDPLLQRVQPVLDWLSDEDQKAANERDFQAALIRLESALYASPQLSPSELERLGNAALKFNRPLPETVDAQYRSLLHAASRKSERRRRAIVLLIAGSVMTAVIVVAAIMFSSHRKEQVRLVVARVLKLANEGNLDEARREFERGQNDPATAATPEYIELGIQLRSLEEKEKSRSGEFENLLRESESAPPGESLPPTLVEAKRIARTTEEISRVERLERDRARAHAEDRKSRETTIANRIGDIGKRLVEAEASIESESSTDDVGHTLSKLAKETGQLERDVKDLDSSLRSQVSAVTGRFKLATDRYTRIREQLDFEQQLVRAAIEMNGGESTYQAYTNLINKQLGRTPETMRARDLKRVLQEADAWKAALGWSDIVRTWRNIREESPGIATKRLGDCQAFAKKHPKTPDNGAIREAIQYWSAIAKRRDSADAATTDDDDDSEDRGMRTRLRLMYSDMVIANTWMVTTDSGKKFYSSQDFSFGTGDSVTVPVFVGFDGSSKRKNFLRKDIAGGRAVRAPQAVIADEVIRALKTLDDAKWDETMIQYLNRIRSDSDIDPLLKLILLRRTLEFAMGGSYVLQQELQEYEQALERSGVNLTVPWMDPESVSGPKARNDAKLFLATLSNPDLTAKTLDQRYEQLSKRLLSAVRPVGCLFQTRKGNWIVRSTDSLKEPDRSTQLFIVASKSDGGILWKQVGEMTAASIQVSTGDPEALVEGRPVFLRLREKTP